MGARTADNQRSFFDSHPKIMINVDAHNWNLVSFSKGIEIFAMQQKVCLSVDEK